MPGVKAKVRAALKAELTLIVIYGDCGTGSQLDMFRNEENILRVPGPHCHHSLMGEAGFDMAMDQELGTFFLTDYVARHFEQILMRVMVLGDHPHLRDIYFAHY